MNTKLLTDAAHLAPVEVNEIQRLPRRLHKPSILYLSASGGTAGSGTYVDAAIRAAGGTNIITMPGWHTPSIESLVNSQSRYLVGVLAEAKKLIDAGKTTEGGFLLLRVYRGLPKNKALIKFLSQEGIKQLLQKTENFYMQDNNREMPKVDKELLFVIDEKNNSIELTDKGIEALSGKGGDKNFFVLPDISTEIGIIDKSSDSPEEKLAKKEEVYREFSMKSERIHTMNQLLKAYTLFEKDVEYVNMDGKIMIVDEQTGRIMEGRRYSDGLHQAIEAKENVKVEAASQTLATVTLQNFFRMYHKLSGMTVLPKLKHKSFGIFINLM